MSSWLLSAKAKADLDGIRDYTIDTWDIEQAKNYISEPLQVIERVARSPKHGAPCEHLGAGTRKVRSNSHLIYYRMVDDDLIVRRILHESMNIRRHL